MSVREMTGPTLGHRDQQVFLPTPGRGASHGIVDIGVEACELLLQSLDEARDALRETRYRHAFLALAFGPDHLDDLPSRRPFETSIPRMILFMRAKRRCR
jgi:hypothetical protein